MSLLQGALLHIHRRPGYEAFPYLAALAAANWLLHRHLAFRLMAESVEIFENAIVLRRGRHTFPYQWADMRSFHSARKFGLYLLRLGTADDRHYVFDSAYEDMLGLRYTLLRLTGRPIMAHLLEQFNRNLSIRSGPLEVTHGGIYLDNRHYGRRLVVWENVVTAGIDDDLWQIHILERNFQGRTPREFVRLSLDTMPNAHALALLIDHIAQWQHGHRLKSRKPPDSRFGPISAI